MMTAAGFLKNGSFVERVLWEISSTCVDTKPRGIEATCIVSGDRRRSCIISYNKQQNFDGVFVRVYE